MKAKAFWQTLVLAVLGLVILGPGLMVGPHDYSLSEIWKGLSGNSENEILLGVIRDIRLPRILLALVSGAVLTLGGFFIQALIRNPLGDPFIMGVSSGAGFGVNLLILGFFPFLAGSLFALPFAAFVGGMASLAFVLVLGGKNMQDNSARLLIAGVAVSSFFTAGTGVVIYEFADDDQLRKIMFWAFGSLDKATWEAVMIGTVMLVVGLLFGLVMARRMDLLILGEIQAKHLGLNVGALKISLLAVTALVVGATVAFTGPIGFVGMMIPHFSRAINRIDHRSNLIFGTIFGGVYLAGCDLLNQLLHPPAGLPIGIVTSVLGVPFFLWLLFRKGRIF